MKPWYKSDTMRFNLILLGAAMFAPSIPDDARKFIIGLTISNILLRLKTNAKIQ